MRIKGFPAILKKKLERTESHAEFILSIRLKVVKEANVPY